MLKLERRSNSELLSKICTGRERAWINEQAESCFQPYWSKIVFCIKETLYKVFNPIYDVFLGFEEAEIYLKPVDKTFAADIFQRETKIECRYSGSFGMDNDFTYASTLLGNGPASG